MHLLTDLPRYHQFSIRINKITGHGVTLLYMSQTLQNVVKEIRVTLVCLTLDIRVKGKGLETANAYPSAFR